MSYASDRQQASFARAERAYDRMLAAGPPEPATATVDVRARLFAEGPYDNPAQVETWLREQLGADETITFIEEDDTVHFDIETFVEEAESLDHARELFENLATGGPHDLVIEDIDIDDPEDAYEPDWDAINKDRRIDEMFD